MAILRDCYFQRGFAKALRKRDVKYLDKDVLIYVSTAVKRRV